MFYSSVLIVDRIFTFTVAAMQGHRHPPNTRISAGMTSAATPVKPLIAERFSILPVRGKRWMRSNSSYIPSVTFLPKKRVAKNRRAAAKCLELCSKPRMQG
jgi:hypothetical protein